MTAAPVAGATRAGPCPSGDRTADAIDAIDQDRSVLDAVLAHGAVTTAFQPIVDLSTGHLVAYEALARGPAGRLRQPDALFAAATRAGRLADLDELCRRTALTSALEQGIAAPATLFINVEPGVLRPETFEELIDIAACARESPGMVLEITERALAARPAELLAAVARLREAGWRIALDDVGADDMSLTFLSVLQPDVVKIDMAVVQKQPGAATASLLSALTACSERSGALLLAEGIESEVHLATARSLGASLGQGWHFGRPATTPDRRRPPRAMSFPARAAPVAASSPFDCLDPAVGTRVAGKKLLIEVSKHLEREAARIGDTAVILSTFQRVEHFTPATRTRYERLAQAVGFVAAFGADMPPTPVDGVRGADLHVDDPLRAEWDVVVLSPHFAAALIARDLSSVSDTAEGPVAQDRLFQFVFTHDRAVAAAAAANLMARVLPQ